MNEALYDGRVERRKVGTKVTQLVVVDDIDSWIVQVEPLRNLRATRDDVDLSDPGREHGRGPETIPQQIVRIPHPLRVSCFEPEAYWRMSA